MISSIGGSSSGPSMLQMMQARLQEMQARTDANGDGEVSLAEFKAGAPQGATGLEDMFAAADADGDGQLTQP